MLANEAYEEIWFRKVQTSEAYEERWLRKMLATRAYQEGVSEHVSH